MGGTRQPGKKETPGCRLIAAARARPGHADPMPADVVSDMPGNHRSSRLPRSSHCVTEPARTASIRERPPVLVADAFALSTHRGVTHLSPHAWGRCVSASSLWRFTMSTTSNEKSYFDLHTSGIGYIQRAREVPVRGGRRAQPFLACTIAALVGSAKDPSYRYFDVKVSGAEAKKLVERYIGVDDPKQRPLVRFRLGDLWGDAYIRDKGEHKGQAAASLKARLLKAEPLDRAELASIKQHELITRGIGYLSRPKDVSPKDGDPFLSCCVAALAGPVGEPEYRYFDTIVATPEAEHLVRRCVQAIEGDRKVLIAFRLNDMKIDPYIRTKGERAGEPGASLESTLVHIGLIKIDGTQVYPTSQTQAEAPQAEDAPAPEAEVAAETAADQPVEPAEREPAGEVEEQEPALAASF
ncbi:conserved hypothetical protein [Xanthomonas euvesicatoria pv. vesicatoria str. 85-10]|uniref:DUF3577 domain-containing protein n=5 Tax=Gammaproteobacteria TaxID=1236 RepID=Q3BSY7_XANE5|nr:conserved hypothetical protein [Xanthomonas euvesicatoria pv. vesicatoria str. 85-10]